MNPGRSNGAWEIKMMPGSSKWSLGGPKELAPFKWSSESKWSLERPNEPWSFQMEPGVLE